jgi:hypothetical protein
MAHSILALVLAALGLSAASSTQFANPALDPRGAGVRNLRLDAAPAQPARVEPGMVRIPIPADGVMYEVIVVSPGVPRLIPLGR